MRFRLLAGQHVTGRHPCRVYRAGDIVESSVDLVARFGDQKFQLIEGEPTITASTAGATAPGGQVGSGHQETRTDRETGRPVTGLAVPKMAKVKKETPKTEEPPKPSVSAQPAAPAKPQRSPGATPPTRQFSVDVPPRRRRR